MREARGGEPVDLPAMDGRGGRFGQPGHLGSSSEMIDYGRSDDVHASRYAIIGSLTQAPTSDIRDCAGSSAVANGRVANIQSNQPEAIEVFEKLKKVGATQRQLADVLGIAENKVSKIRSGERQITAGEYRKAMDWLEAGEGLDGAEKVDASREYLSVDVLPTYAGMGGGGTGDADPETALVPRALIEDILRGKPSDFLIINVRGDSMEPDFHHGDQLLVDKRDTSPAQPGYFALWDGEWGEYVVKNVERSRAGEVRIFSSNPKYTAESAASETTRIIGRPVWFGRRL